MSDARNMPLTGTFRGALLEPSVRRRAEAEGRRRAIESSSRSLDAAYRDGKREAIAIALIREAEGW